ncbi:DegV family protein [Allobaculum sp. Allo2]|uniref:DegV family protein n=1 Tax=Allobaculum sp. Allo2 TaxID=2853432 RepID=UPI001F615949|nr:DegV family protein [Allobaculum sp. Allo2]UNT93679.1 DegV family protein [Allobaculum sp. Allo2]
MIWIVTDSAQELKEEEQEGLRVVSLPICVNEKLLDHPIENEDFFALLEEESNVLSTSQPSPSAFEAVFEELTSRGDEVIALLLSSSLSGTYNSARLALLDHEAWQENVHLIDSGQACLSQSVLVARALELRNAGKSAKEIIETIEKEKKQVRLFAMLPTLKYLKKGGRISPAKAALADLAGVRALVTIDENGEITACAKTRGTKREFAAWPNSPQTAASMRIARCLWAIPVWMNSRCATCRALCVKSSDRRFLRRRPQFLRC